MHSRGSRFIFEWQKEGGQQKGRVTVHFWEDDRHANHFAYSTGFFSFSSFVECFPWASILRLILIYLESTIKQGPSSYYFLWDTEAYLGEIRFLLNPERRNHQAPPACFTNKCHLKSSMPLVCSLYFQPVLSWLGC